MPTINTGSAPAASSTGSATPSTSTYSASQRSGGTMTSGTTVEGPEIVSEGVNGLAESSKMAVTGTDPTMHALNLSNYMFRIGFLGQQWTDVTILFFDQAVNLHRIILARSPLLAQSMLNHPPGQPVRMTFSDDNITPESVHIALHHLYNPAERLVNPDNCRAVLATAFLFEGMQELVHHAYTICRDSISHDRILDFVRWLGPSLSSSSSSHAFNPDSGTTFGSVMVRDGCASIAGREVSDGWKDEGMGRYGEWTMRIKTDVIDYLTGTLPESLLETSRSLTDNPFFLSIYTHLPFDLFKLCIESPELPIPTTQARFTFAKKAITHRKKLAGSGGMEESVVLAVASDQGAIHVTRKTKRKRMPLWKVEG